MGDLVCRERLHLTHEQDLGRVTSTWITRYDATFADGQQHAFYVNEPSVPASGVNFLSGSQTYTPNERYHIEGARRAKRAVQEAVAEAQFPGIKRAVRAGETVTFGVLAADESGLTLDDTKYPWDQLQLERHEVNGRRAVADGATSAKLETHYAVGLQGESDLRMVAAHQIHNLGAFNLLVADVNRRLNP